MYETLLPVRPHDHERPTASESRHDEPRIALIDRLSFRLGLWLLLRGARRIESGRDHNDRRRLLSNLRAREARERAAAHEHLMYFRGGRS